MERFIEELQTTADRNVFVMIRYADTPQFLEIETSIRSALTNSLPRRPPRFSPPVSIAERSGKDRTSRGIWLDVGAQLADQSPLGKRNNKRNPGASRG
jgi:hypothetical protein